jgi:hypothetical protein
VGPVRGSERRVFASEVNSRTSLGRNWGALGGHFRGEEAPSWMIFYLAGHFLIPFTAGMRRQSLSGERKVPPIYYGGLEERPANRPPGVSGL